MILKEVFCVLKGAGAVSSESEFSRDWLGRSESYLRNIRFNDLEPSLSSIAMCASKLQHFGEELLDDEQSKHLGHQLLDMARRCHAHIQAQNTSD